MANDVPSAADIFLRRKAPTGRRPPRPVTPGLFDEPFPGGDASSESAAASDAAPLAPARPGPDIFAVEPPIAARKFAEPAPPQWPEAQVATPPVLPGLAVLPTRPVLPVAPGVPAPAPADRAASADRAAAAMRVWTVGALVRDVRAAVEGRFGRVAVEGEISNWRPAGSGHCYFTLKDGAAQLSAVIFRREAALLRFRPKDGDAVRLRGQVSIYENRGQMQLIAESMELAGMGAQLLAVQELKARLKREGVFANARPLPAFPRCIGVVTSLQGAALRDIVKVCRRRHAAVNLLVYPAAVQGPRCAVEVAAGVQWFSLRSEGGVARPGSVDVVLVARGGGSWEDLHGFDDERIARTIAACSVPVISGVGHATDSTVADAAADVCAPTPSAAAELLTAAQHGVEQRVERAASRLERAGRYELLRARQRVAEAGVEAMLRRVRDALRRREQRLDDLSFRLAAAPGRLFAARAERVRALEHRLQRQNVRWQLAERRQRLEAFEARLQRVAAATVAVRSERLQRLEVRAEAMSPLRVLERGYALVFGPDGHLLRSASDIAPGDTLTARLRQGTVRAVVAAPE